MSQKKINRQQKSQETHKAAGGADRFIKPVALVLAVFALIGGLMYLFAPSSKLEPYNKFKEDAKATAAKPDEKKDSPSLSPTREAEEVAKTAMSSVKETDSLIKKVVNSEPTPQKNASNLPRETLEHISKGMALTEQGRFEHAEIEFEQASKLSPNSPEVYAIWATSLKMQKKFVGANKRFAEANRLAPNDDEILFNWGMTKLEDGKSDEAIDLFQRTLKSNPKQFLAYNYMGKAYGQKKEYAKETEMYKKMLEFDPNFAQAHFNLGVVLSIRDKVEEAAPHFEKAIELDKQFDQPFVTKMLKAMGRYKEPATKKPEKPENTQVAKHEDHKIQDSLKKPEGSDTKGKGEHQMEGSSSKPEKDFVKVSGKVMINGVPMAKNGVVFLETKTKLRVTGQKPVSLTVMQKGLRFEPVHSTVVVGSSVTFTNDDMEVHNIYSKSINNQFNLGAMAGGSSKTIKLSTPGPVVLRCNMHKDMIGTIFVVPNGHYTHPNENGEYSFTNVANQEYILQAWHPSMAPEDVEKNLRGVKLDGKDETFDFAIASASKLDEIHDMVNTKDYSLIADDIEKEMFQAIEDWKAGKTYISRNRMLSAITKHFEGEGLKDAITKSFSEKRSQMLEEKLDIIRKKISGLGPYADQKFTKEGLQSEAKLAMDQIRENVRELHNRLNPTQ